MKVAEVFDPYNLMTRPRKMVLKRSRSVDKPLHKVQLNRAKSFQSFLAKS
jgi:hypothetical protein